MQGGELAELATFVAVARQRSFRKAAVERGVAASAVSHAIRSLEGWGCGISQDHPQRAIRA